MGRTVTGRRPSSRRSTSSANVRGNTKDRARRRAYLIRTYRADVDLVLRHPENPTHPPLLVPAARCHACGVLVHDRAAFPDGTVVLPTISPDRIIPGCEGGTYAHANVRPSCVPCQSDQGGVIGAARARLLKETQP